MDIGIHLAFNGNCREALEFYQSIFGGTLRMLSFGESPAAASVAEDWQDKIVHANLKIGDKEIAACDLPAETYKKPQGFSILVETGDGEKVKTIFAALSAGGIVVMAPQETFWSKHYCVVTDRYGISWEIY